MKAISEKSKFAKMLILTLLFTNCFGIIFLNINVLKYVYTLIFLCCLVVLNKVNIPNKKTIVAYVFFVICSCIYSSLYNDQNFIRVLGNSYPYLGVLFIFIIMKYKMCSSTLEKAILFISIIFCCCYIFQWIIYPIQVFAGSLDEININKGYFRMRMPGSISAYCLFFYGINQYLIKRRKKYLLYCALGFLPIIIMGFRSLTSLTVLFAVIMIPFITKSITKTFLWLVVAIVALIAISQVGVVREKIDEMMERQESGQTFNNEDYIRILEYEYFDDVIFVKPGEHFWGGGAPADKTSHYARNIFDGAERLRYYWQDLGIVGLSFIIGIPAIVLLIYLIIDSIRNARSNRLQYIRFTLLTVLLGSIITSMELFREGNIIILSLYLCLIYTRKLEDKGSLAKIYSQTETYCEKV